MNKEDLRKSEPVDNRLDELTSIRMQLILHKLGITVPDAKDLAGYLFSLLVEARRKIEVLQEPKTLSPESLREVLDALKWAGEQTEAYGLFPVMIRSAIKKLEQLL